MGKKYFSLSTQIKICMAVILLLVLVGGLITLRDVNVLWNQTDNIYNHPLIVRRSLGNIQNEINSIQTNFQRVSLKENEADLIVIVHDIKLCEAEVAIQLGIVRKNFLGPIELVDSAIESFAQWKTKRDIKIEFLLEGNLINEFVDNSKTKEIVSKANLLESINEMSDYADLKGDAFFDQAKKEKNSLSVNFILMLILLLVLIFWILLYLLKSIQKPLDKITTASDNFRKGRYNTRCGYSSNNEFGMLSISFNNLAEKIQLELINRENVRNITDALLKNEDIETFVLDLLKILMQKTKSQMGCIHVLNEAKTEYACVKSIGVNKEDCKNVQVGDIDGEFGLAISTKDIQYIENIPEDTFMCFSVMIGKIKPKEMIVIPIFSNDKPVAIVSLANIHVYSSSVIRLIEDSKSIVKARINNIVSSEKNILISKKVAIQNEELKVQKEELKVLTLEQNKQSVELAMQQKELISANRLKSSFLSNMSHELRTPLNSVISLSSILIRKMKDIVSDKELEYLNVIQRNGQHLLILINDILNISRIESGKEETIYSTFSIKSLVNDTVEMILPQAQEKNVSINNEIPDNLQHITSDIKKCQHIVQNLIGNAVKFTDKGQVDISAYIKNDFVNVVVSDTGIGIEGKQLKYIFDEFRQIDDSISKKYEGTGLGLAIAKKYAVLLKGDIFVKSTVGRGSEFTMKLPLYKDRIIQTDKKEQEIVKNTESDSKKQNIPFKNREKTILIVDDSEPALIQLSDMLKEDDYNIVIARDGVEALSKINEVELDAVVLDLMMPHIDGFQVLRTLRSDEKTVKLPVLVLTAKYISKKELEALNSNDIYQLIQKGDVSKKQLLTVIGGMFRSEVHNGK